VVELKSTDFFKNNIIKMDRLLDRQSTHVQIAFNDAIVELRWLSRLDCLLHLAGLDDPLLRLAGGQSPHEKDNHQGQNYSIQRERFRRETSI
jgi:hypothetical protein